MLRRATFLLHAKDRLSRLRARVGELWWITVLSFMIHRLADAINAFIGLWLVPRYVPVDELGTLLPLTNVSSMMALPLTLVAFPLLKFLTQYLQEGAFGKAKQILRDTLFLALGLFVILFAVSPIVMPAVFARMRIVDGLLSVLIVITGVVAALHPIFIIILQAQKLFIAMAFFSFVISVLRMAVMLVCLPIRGVSGYFVGQIVPNLFLFGAALYLSRSILGRRVKCQPYLDKDGWAIVRYSIAPVAYALCATFAVTVHTFVIRRCLPDIDSAAYYMLMRFADIALTIGTTCALILFPLAAEKNAPGEAYPRLLRHAITIPLAGGTLFTLVATPAVWLLFRHVSVWTCYLPYIPHLAVLCLSSAVRGAVYCYFTFQCARNSFRFVPFFCILLSIEGVLLYALTGYTFFTPYVPSSWINALDAFNPNRLSVVIAIPILFDLLLFIYILADIFKAQTKLRKLCVETDHSVPFPRI
jgi:hypothetical protein